MAIDDRVLSGGQGDAHVCHEMRRRAIKIWPCGVGVERRCHPSRCEGGQRTSVCLCCYALLSSLPGCNHVLLRSRRPAMWCLRDTGLASRSEADPALWWAWSQVVFACWSIVASRVCTHLRTVRSGGVARHARVYAVARASSRLVRRGRADGPCKRVRCARPAPAVV